MITSKAIFYQYDKNNDKILTIKEFKTPWRNFANIFNKSTKDLLNLWKKYESNVSINGKQKSFREINYKGLSEEGLTMMLSELILSNVNGILRHARQEGYASFVEEYFEGQR